LFLKKEPKTFASLGSAFPGEAGAKQSKVFCFFFSKKKAFLAFFEPHTRPTWAVILHADAARRAIRHR
jgi:hypothetical protein